MSARDFFTVEDREEIESAITEAEKVTSGEIRVHLENSCDESALDHAAWIFEKLEMHKTAKRNGVLIYLAVEDRKFAVLGDVGLNAQVPENFWVKTKDEMKVDFLNGDFKVGLINAIRNIGSDLKAYYPLKQKDMNELPNEISFGEDDV